jgi:hypothetical protein
VAALTAAGGLALVALLIGLGLLRGRRRLVLFLRRFRLPGASEGNRLDALVGQPAGPEPGNPMVQRLMLLLDGKTALAYSTGRRPMRRFARALRASLDGAV